MERCTRCTGLYRWDSEVTGLVCMNCGRIVYWPITRTAYTGLSVLPDPDIPRWPKHGVLGPGRLFTRKQWSGDGNGN